MKRNMRRLKPKSFLLPMAQTATHVQKANIDTYGYPRLVRPPTRLANYPSSLAGSNFRPHIPFNQMQNNSKEYRLETEINPPASFYSIVNEANQQRNDLSQSPHSCNNPNSKNDVVSDTDMKSPFAQRLFAYNTRNYSQNIKRNDNRNFNPTKELADKNPTLSAAKGRDSLEHKNPRHNYNASTQPKQSSDMDSFISTKVAEIQQPKDRESSQKCIHTGAGQTLSRKFGLGLDGVAESVLFDKSLFENEINRAQIANFLKIYNYRDIKFYMNIYQDFKKSDILEISSYWMGILDGPIKSRFQDYDLNRLLDNETFRHNLKFCLVLFIYNPNVEYIVRQKINFPLIIYPLKKFSYFTNETDLLFEWNERLELFVIGYEFDVMHYATEIPVYFIKNWIIFEDDFPLRLSDYCVEKFGTEWRGTLKEKYNVHVKFLSCDTKKNAQKAYETCFRMYKQCIYYKSYDENNVERYNSNWYYECFTNGTPILTTDESDFDYYDYFDNSYNLRWTKELTNDPNGIRNLFNAKNICKMSGLIYSWKKFVLDSKNDIVDYFRHVHFNLFKLCRTQDKKNRDVELLL